MAKIEKTPNGKWSARIFWRSPDGKQLTKYKSGFTKKTEAEHWAVAAQAIAGSEYVEAHKLKMSAFLDEWISAVEPNLSPSTVASYKTDIKKLKPLLGAHLVISLRTTHIQKAINQLTGRPKTVDRAYRTLRAALSYAVKIGILQVNPAHHVDRPKGAPYQYSILDASEARELLTKLKEMEHILYLPVLLALMMGLRRGEVFGLKWSNVDLERKKAMIETSIIFADNKMIERDQVKTKSSYAQVPIPAIVVDELKHLTLDMMKSGKIHTYVCANFSENFISHISHKLQSFQEANNLKQCRFHDLRHSTASILNEAGVPMTTISALLRHSSPTITQNIYTHIFDDSLTKATENMNKIINMHIDKQEKGL